MQDAIAKADGANTEEAYNEAVSGISIDSLVPTQFSKEELNKVLRGLIGKLERDYTEESWKELQDAIDTADSAKLKSEYDAVKDKLTINNLVLEEDKGFIGDLIERVQEDTMMLVLVIVIRYIVSNSNSCYNLIN